MKVVLSEASHTSYGFIAKIPGASCLMSYWYAKAPRDSTGRKICEHIRNAKRPANDFFYMDSGVFSSRKRGTVITVVELVDFFRKNADIISWVFNLDTGNHQQQLANAKALKDAGVPVIGIYHGDMPLDYIDRFADINPYVALSYFAVGGMKGDQTNIDKYHNRIFGYLHKRSLTKLPIHLLGTERKEIILNYPAYSCDATSFANDYMYGKLGYFCPVEKKIKNRTVGRSMTKKDMVRAVQADHTAIDMMADCGRSGIDKRIVAAATARIELQRHVTGIWDARGVKWDDQAIFKSTR